MSGGIQDGQPSTPQPMTPAEPVEMMAIGNTPVAPWASAPDGVSQAPGSPGSHVASCFSSLLRESSINMSENGLLMDGTGEGGAARGSDPFGDIQLQSSVPSHSAELTSLNTQIQEVARQEDREMRLAHEPHGLALAPTLQDSPGKNTYSSLSHHASGVHAETVQQMEHDHGGNLGEHEAAPIHFPEAGGAESMEMGSIQQESFPEVPRSAHVGDAVAVLIGAGQPALVPSHPPGNANSEQTPVPQMIQPYGAQAEGSTMPYPVDQPEADYSVHGGGSFNGHPFAGEQRQGGMGPVSPSFEAAGQSNVAVLPNTVGMSVIAAPVQSHMSGTVLMPQQGMFPTQASIPQQQGMQGTYSGMQQGMQQGMMQQGMMQQGMMQQGMMQQSMVQGSMGSLEGQDVALHPAGAVPPMHFSSGASSGSDHQGPSPPGNISRGGAYPSDRPSSLSPSAAQGVGVQMGVGVQNQAIVQAQEQVAGRMVAAAEEKFVQASNAVQHQKAISHQYVVATHHQAQQQVRAAEQAQAVAEHNLVRVQQSVAPDPYTGQADDAQIANAAQQYVAAKHQLDATKQYVAAQQEAVQQQVAQAEHEVQQQRVAAAHHLVAVQQEVEHVLSTTAPGVKTVSPSTAGSSASAEDGRVVKQEGMLGLNKDKSPDQVTVWQVQGMRDTIDQQQMQIAQQLRTIEELRQLQQHGGPMPQAATAAAMPAPAMPAPAMPAAGLPGATMSTMATSRHMGHPMQPTLPSSSPGAHPAGTPVHFVQMPGQMSDQMGMLPGGSGGVAGIATRPIAFSPQAMFPAALPMGVGTSAHFMSMDPLQHGAIPGAMLASATAGDPNADARLLAGQRPVKRLSNGRTGKRNLNKDVVKMLKDWFTENQKWPYPTDQQQLDLARRTNVDPKVVNTWFINARKRHKTKGGEGAAADERTAEDGEDAGGDGDDVSSPDMAAPEVSPPEAAASGETEASASKASGSSTTSGGEADEKSEARAVVQKANAGPVGPAAPAAPSPAGE